MVITGWYDHIIPPQGYKGYRGMIYHPPPPSGYNGIISTNEIQSTCASDTTIELESMAVSLCVYGTLQEAGGADCH